MKTRNALMAKWHRQGYTYREIAKRYNLTSNRVGDIVREYTDIVKEVLQFHLETKSNLQLKEIAEMLNLSLKELEYYL